MLEAILFPPGKQKNQNAGNPFFNHKILAVMRLLAIKLPAIILVATLLVDKTAWAEDLAVTAAIVNDSIYRGISLSEEQPGVQIFIDKNFEPGFFVGGNLTRHQTSGRFSRQGWQSFYSGYYQQFSQDSAFETSISSISFDADFFRSWDYLELKTTLYFSQSTGISFAYADNYYGREHPSYYAEFSWQPQLDDAWYATVTLGNTYTDGLENAESFANYLLGVSHNQKRWQYFLAYTLVDHDISYVHGDNATGGRWLFNVSYSLF